MSDSKIFRCSVNMCVAKANPTLLTHTLFDVSHKEPLGSPIDEFLTRLEEINKLSPLPDGFNPYQGQLILLGAIAAVESFIRTIFRKIIVHDPMARRSVHEREVTYGAALHLSEDLLPEALLEKISFVGEKSIVGALRDLLGVKGNIPADLKLAIDQYVRVCQLRHCAVHRFGKLGVNNAIALGLDEHKDLLEKPLKYDYETLQNSIAIATGFVKTMNNFLFNEIISRVPPTVWTGVYTSDKSTFRIYYNLFSDKTSSKSTPAPKVVYTQFQKQFNAWNKAPIRATPPS